MFTINLLPKHIFLVTDSTLASDDPFHRKKNLSERI